MGSSGEVENRGEKRAVVSSVEEWYIYTFIHTYVHMRMVVGIHH